MLICPGAADTKKEKKTITITEEISISPNSTQEKTDSESIQNAVDLAVKAGVNNVVIPRVNERTASCVWEISETILLPSDITIILDNCLMRMADDVMCNFFRNSNALTPISAKPEGEQRNITIQGVGNAVLDGGKSNELNESTSCKNGFPHVCLNTPILMMNVRHFAVENLSILNQRYWGMRFEYARCGKIRNIFTNVKRDRRNQDGINLRNDCNNILIENIHGQTGDDMIALSAIDGKRSDMYNLILEGHDSDIHDVTIRNISGAAIRHPLDALRNHNGAKIYNVLIENVRDTDYLQPFDGGIYERTALILLGNNSYFRERPAVMGETFGITVKDIFARYSARAIYTQSVMKDCCFTNIHASGECKSILAVTPDGWGDDARSERMKKSL